MENSAEKDLLEKLYTSMQFEDEEKNEDLLVELKPLLKIRAQIANKLLNPHSLTEAAKRDYQELYHYYDAYLCERLGLLTMNLAFFPPAVLKRIDETWVEAPSSLLKTFSNPAQIQDELNEAIFIAMKFEHVSEMIKPLLFWGQSRQDIKPGTSITQEILKRLKEYDEMKKELEGHRANPIK